MVSGHDPDAYFVVDDGTGVHDIVAVRGNGSLIGRVEVQGMSAGNAEALSAGPCGDRGGRCFYVGDIGDNAVKRSRISVYRLDEPSLRPLPATPVAADRWDYVYPDGPHNAEAMLVDADGSLLIITKSARNDAGVVPPHRIYRASPGGGTLTYLSSFTPPAPSRSAQSLFTGTVVTDAAASNGRVLILTYDEVTQYAAPKAGAALADFASWPHRELPDPPMIQTEGIAFQTAGCGYEVTSEQGPAGTRSAMAAVLCR
ncbi:hypothetical protein SAMN04515671_2191 [Nakamurella panacisegetis]|uniref:Esterase-like activity of phytase n=1 Tax=Nakamurella panacisegetis TaxID=1090615 RepID=A0A1H0N3Y5_9ACTN|nr:hypothetical protein SAMN04515671_2191 [Nakamurella panacisegetis]